MACSHRYSALGNRRWEALSILVLARRELEHLERRKPEAPEPKALEVGAPWKHSMAPRKAPHNVAPHSEHSMAIGGPHSEDLHFDLEPVNHQISVHFQGKSLACLPAHALHAPCLPGCLSECPFALVQCRKKSPGKPCGVHRFEKLDMTRLPGSSKHLRRVGLPHE